MTDQTGAGTAAASGGTHQAHIANSVSAPAGVPPEFHQPVPLDRTRGHSPARDARERAQQPGATEEGHGGQQQGAEWIDIDGTKFTSREVRDAIAHRAEAEVRQRSLPASPDKYEVKLPADFKAPEGVQFELDQNSPDLARFKQLAHARGVDQATFSDMLSVYVANRIGEQQQIEVARTAERSKLGSAADNRISAIDTWLRGIAGDKSAVLVSQLKAFPVASMIETLEAVMLHASNQGVAGYSQSQRDRPDNSGKIAGYDGMNFMQKRLAQDQRAGRVIAPAGQGGRR